MNRQRLLELAGIGANMNNPSQEPYSEVPTTAEDPTGGPGTAGYAEIGDAGCEENPLDKIKELVEKGAEDPDAAMAACREIMHLLSGIEGDEEPQGEEKDEKGEISFSSSHR